MITALKFKDVIKRRIRQLGKLKISDRVEPIARTPASATLKDQKDKFRSIQRVV